MKKIFNFKQSDKKYVLSIETSCDDTCISLVSDMENIYSEIISSAKEQSNFGGVVPELAARKHEENIMDAYIKIIEKSNIDPTKDIEHITYTGTPGMKICLLIGETFAKTLSFILKKPCFSINHIHAHLFSFAINQKKVYPFIGLVASGGHTSLYLVNSIEDIILLTSTLDDAVGECYDKVARSLGLAYPGGPIIDKLYNEDKTSINFLNEFPHPYADFSFSGLKSSVLNYINTNKMKNVENDNISILSSFQKIVIKIILEKIKYYSNKYNIKTVAIGGGVSANKLLRSELNKQDYKLLIPELQYTGDNAVMIGVLFKIMQND